MAHFSLGVYRLSINVMKCISDAVKNYHSVPQICLSASIAKYPNVNIFIFMCNHYALGSHLSRLIGYHHLFDTIKHNGLPLVDDTLLVRDERFSLLAFVDFFRMTTGPPFLCCCRTASA